MGPAPRERFHTSVFDIPCSIFNILFLSNLSDGSVENSEYSFALTIRPGFPCLNNSELRLLEASFRSPPAEGFKLFHNNARGEGILVRAGRVGQTFAGCPDVDLIMKRDDAEIFDSDLRGLLQ